MRAKKVNLYEAIAEALEIIADCVRLIYIDKKKEQFWGGAVEDDA